jgi:hypothetical protein
MIEESRASGATTRSEEVDDDEHQGHVVQAASEGGRWVGASCRFAIPALVSISSFGTPSGW